VRLIDDTDGHCFELLPEGFALLAPAEPPVAPAAQAKAPPRVLTVHSSDGSAARWEETDAGWRKQGG
jgi:hypothetical protein